MTHPYRMTLQMKDLLRRFGEVQATTSFYATARLPGPVEYPGQQYSSDSLEPGEPALIVKISGDGATRIGPTNNSEGSPSDTVKLMELPEDEFWFFEAFRPALSRLSLGAPDCLFEMALVNLYGVFEAFIADTIRLRLRLKPDLLSAKAKRALVSNASADDTALERVIDQDVRRVTHASIVALLQFMRAELEMADLRASLDDKIQEIALVRNCLLHNGGRIDRRLAAAHASYTEGERLEVTDARLTTMAKALRDLAYAVDKEAAG